MACINGDLKTAQMFVQKSVEFKFDLNTKSADGYTAFKLACINGYSEIAEMLKMKSEEFNIDLELPEESETGQKLRHKFFHPLHSMGLPN